MSPRPKRLPRLWCARLGLLPWDTRRAMIPVREADGPAGTGGGNIGLFRGGGSPQSPPSSDPASASSAFRPPSGGGA